MKTACITGANRGIGLGFVKELLCKGYYVIATVRNIEKIGELKTLIDNEQGCILELDISQEKSVDTFSKKINHIKNLDLLINNAGILMDGEKDLFSLSSHDFESSFRTNAIGPFLVFRALLPWLKKSKKPVVAHITSQMGSIQDNGSGGYYAYRSSKAALNMINKSLAIDVPEVTSIVLHPGWVKTDMGGPNAMITIAASVAGLLSVIEKVTEKDSGRFYNYKGEELPW